MMTDISITETTNKAIIKKILMTHKLWEMNCFGVNKEGFIPDMFFKWLLIKNEKEIVGLVKLRNITNVCADIHINILPHFQGSSFSVSAMEELRKYLKENTLLITVMTTVPDQCYYVHKFINKIPGCFNTGHLTDSIIYQNKLQDMIIYQITL